MKSLKIDENGDVVFNSIGRHVFVEDNDLIIQSLNLRFKTLKEELFYNDQYGKPIFKGKYTDDNILSFLKDALMDDTRISDIEISNYSFLNGKLNIDVLIYLNTEETLDLNLSI